MTGWLDRYHAGEHESVWAEMVSLGPNVRSKPYLEPAWSVAQETMRRARYNVETIVKRLDQIGYEFWNGRHGPVRPAVNLSSVEALYKSAMEHSPALQSAAFRQQFGQLLEKAKVMRATTDVLRNLDAPLAPITSHLEDDTVFSPPSASTNALIRKLEKSGMFLPLSLKAWAEAVGDINLSGAHPTLCFWRDEKFPGILADPLMITLGNLEFEGKQWLDSQSDSEAAHELNVIIAWNADTKADLAIVDEQIDEGYDICLPANSADAALNNEPHHAHFVDYLRTAFRWGGFPGWEGQEKRPEKELRFLSEGLLPI